MSEEQRPNVFFQGLNAMSKEDRNAFINASISRLEERESLSNDAFELQYIKVFWKHLLNIMDVDEVPVSWFSMIFILYHNEKFPLFIEWLRSIPKPS